MQQILRLFPLLGVMSLAGCATLGSSSTDLGPGATLPQPNSAAMQTAVLTPPPAQQIATAQAMMDISAFVDPAALGLLSAKERSEASSAQFYALQVGRPGAPRAWQGDAGNSGQVVVGPEVLVNSLTCRNFTHTVTVAGKSYVRSGMACRELDGRWSVAG